MSSNETMGSAAVGGVDQSEVIHMVPTPEKTEGQEIVERDELVRLRENLAVLKASVGDTDPQLIQKLEGVVAHLEGNARGIKEEVEALPETKRNAFGRVQEYFKGWGGTGAMKFSMVGVSCFYAGKALVNGVATIDPATVLTYALISAASTGLSYALSHIMMKEKDLLKGGAWDWMRKDFQRVVMLAVVIASSAAGVTRAGIEGAMNDASTLEKAKTLEGASSLGGAAGVLRS